MEHGALTRFLPRMTLKQYLLVIGCNLLNLHYGIIIFYWASGVAESRRQTHTRMKHLESQQFRHQYSFIKYGQFWDGDVPQRSLTSLDDSEAWHSWFSEQNWQSWNQWSIWNEWEQWNDWNDRGGAKFKLLGKNMALSMGVVVVLIFGIILCGVCKKKCKNAPAPSHGSYLYSPQDDQITSQETRTSNWTHYGRHARRSDNTVIRYDIGNQYNTSVGGYDYQNTTQSQYTHHPPVQTAQVEIDRHHPQNQPSAASLNSGAQIDSGQMDPDLQQPPSYTEAIDSDIYTRPVTDSYADQSRTLPENNTKGDTTDADMRNDIDDELPPPPPYSPTFLTSHPPASSTAQHPE